MKARFDATRTLIAAIFAAALAAVGCAALAPTVSKPVPLPDGASWVQTQSDTGSFGSGNSAHSWKVAGDEVWQGRKVRAMQSGNFKVLADPVSAKWIAFERGGKPLLSWDPPIGWDFPMSVGTTWTSKHRLTIHAAKKTIPLEVKFSVEAYEEITVPAGSFETFRIRSTDNLGNENVTWWSPEIGLFIKRVQTRTAKNPSGPGTRETQLVSQTVTK